MADETISNDEKPWQFKPGNPGGPGRSKGSRNKLGEAFIADLYADWQEHGATTIRAMRAERPHEYVKVVASILPKEVKIEHIDDMTDEQVSKRIRQLAADLGVALGITEGIGIASDGTEAPSTSH